MRPYRSFSPVPSFVRRGNQSPRGEGACQEFIQSGKRWLSLYLNSFSDGVYIVCFHLGYLLGLKFFQVYLTLNFGSLTQYSKKNFKNLFSSNNLKLWRRYPSVLPLS